MTRGLVVAVAMVVVGALLVEEANAGCSSHQNCVACLMNTPATILGYFGGEYCKFCPAKSLTRRYPADYFGREVSEEMKNPLFGVCWDEGSTDSKAENRNPDTKNEGGCFVDQDEAVAGWLIPGSSDAEARSKKAMTEEEAIELCSKYTPPPDSTSDRQARSATLTTDDAGSMKANMAEIAVLEGLTDDLMLLTHVRSADPVFYEKNFETTANSHLAGNAAGAGLTVAKTTIGILVPALGTAISITDQVITVGSEAYEALSENIIPLFKKGGAAMTYTFRDVPFNDLNTQYLELIGNVTAAKAETGEIMHPRELVALLKEASDILVEATATAAGGVAATANTVNSHWGFKLAKFTGHTVAAVASGGISLAVSIPVAVGELGIDHGLDIAARKNSQARTWLLLAALYGHECNIRGFFLGETREERATMHDGKKYYDGHIPCSITDYTKPNHGCAPGYYCKRDFVFFPLEGETYANHMKSFVGICAPNAKRRVPVHHPCLVHSDCQSAHCSYGSVSLNKTDEAGKPTAETISVSGDDRWVRLDQPLPEEFLGTSSDITPRGRSNVMQGACLLVQPYPLDEELREKSADEYCADKKNWDCVREVVPGGKAKGWKYVEKPNDPVIPPSFFNSEELNIHTRLLRTSSVDTGARTLQQNTGGRKKKPTGAQEAP